MKRAITLLVFGCLFCLPVACNKSQSGSGSNDANTPSANVTVYVTRSGHKYHCAGCRYLAKSCIPITLSDAKAKGYSPCSVCCPPQ